MIKSIEFPNRTFESKSELFAALKKDCSKLVEMKKATVKHSDPIENGLTTAVKAANMQEGYIYPIINTTNYMDSHSDVHIDGIWNKSVQDQQGKVMYIINHQLEVGKVIAFGQDVEMRLETFNWPDLGKEYQGQTQALVFKTKLFDYSNEDAAKIIKAKMPVENSVRMQYVKIDMAINSDDPDYKNEKATWLKYIDRIANKGRAIEQGYFWAVTEAKIYKEGSMVLAGSNDATPILYPKSELDYTELDAAVKQLSENIENSITKENFLHLCNQFKALHANEPLNLTLKEQPKPQENQQFKSFLINKLK